MLCIWIFCLYVCMCTVCMFSAYRNQKRVSDALELWVLGVGLEEQPVLLTTEPSLQFFSG